MREGRFSGLWERLPAPPFGLAIRSQGPRGVIVKSGNHGRVSRVWVLANAYALLCIGMHAPSRSLWIEAPARAGYHTRPGFA